jgi:copper chaperone CopZ
MIVLTVPGMNSRSDVRTVSAALADVEGVVALEVDLGTRNVHVEGDVSADAVRAAIISSGYGVR